MHTLYTVVTLQFLTEFCEYLEKWEESVKKRKGFKDDEKKRMMLSEETLAGIRMTGTFLQACTCMAHVSMCVHVWCMVHLDCVYMYGTFGMHVHLQCTLTSSSMVMHHKHYYLSI